MRKIDSSKPVTTYKTEFILKPAKAYRCFTCGDVIPAASARKRKDGFYRSAHFVVTARQKGAGQGTQRLRVCFKCTILSAMAEDDTGGMIYPGMFNERTMANINRKRLAQLKKRIQAGEDPLEILQNLVGAKEHQAEEAREKEKHKEAEYDAGSESVNGCNCVVICDDNDNNNDLCTQQDNKQVLREEDTPGSGEDCGADVEQAEAWTGYTPYTWSRELSEDELDERIVNILDKLSEWKKTHPGKC